MSLTVSELGALLLVLFVIGYWLRIFVTLTALAGFLGVVLLGGTGWLGRVLTDIAGWAARLTGDLTGDIIGVAFAAALFIGLAIVFIHDLSPRKSAGKRTAWIGVALGALVVAGVTGIPALSGLHGDIATAASSFVSLF